MFEAKLKTASGKVAFTIDGKPHEAPDGVTIAEAMLLAGLDHTRLSQGCMIRLCEGMAIVRQAGKVKLAP